MNKNFYMDIELLSAEVNIYSNGVFIKKYLHYPGIAYISFKFKPVIAIKDLDNCYYDFNFHDSYPSLNDDYIIIIANKATPLQKTALNRAFPGNDYINVLNSYIGLTRDKTILKQGTDVSHMYYFFDTLCNFSLTKVNRTWFASGNIILTELKNISLELKSACANDNIDYDYMINIINSSEDYYTIINYVNKFPKSARLTKLRHYIMNELCN
jgi:hypothetical protein